jgi:hypothetical protein
MTFPWPETERRPLITRVAIFLGGIALAVAVLTGSISEIRLEYLTGYFGYFGIAAVALGAGFLIGRTLPWRQAALEWPVAKRWRAVFLAAVSLFTFAAPPKGVKVVWDEPLLSVVAASMHFDRLALQPTAGNASGGPYTYLDGKAVKRPLLFPFVVSLLHDLTGYREGNALLLNALCIPLFWWLVFWLARRMGHSEADGYLAVGLLFTLPLALDLATSHGFDFFNSTLILATLVLALRWGETPACAARLGALLGALWLVGNTRYEGPVWIVPFGLFIIWNWWRQKRWEFPTSLALSPLALLLPVCSLHFQSKVAIYWQPGPNDRIAAFQLSYIPENLRYTLNYLFDSRPVAVGSYLLIALGLGAIISLGLLFLRRWSRHPRAIASRQEPTVALESAWSFYFGGCLLFFGVLMAFNWGVFDEYVTARLSLPLHPPLVFLAVLAARRCFPILLWSSLGVSATGILHDSLSWEEGRFLENGLHLFGAHLLLAVALGWLLARRHLRWEHLFVLVAAHALLITLPRARAAHYLHDYTPHRQHLAFHALLDRHTDENILYVATIGYAPLLQRRPSIPQSTLEQASKLLAIRLDEHRAYDKVLLVALYQYSDEFGWRRQHPLLDPDQFDLELEERRWVAPRNEFWIYRVRPKTEAPSVNAPDDVAPNEN